MRGTILFQCGQSDYRKLNASIEKDHFPMTFMDQMLDKLIGKGCYCFLHGYSVNN